MNSSTSKKLSLLIVAAGLLAIAGLIMYLVPKDKLYAPEGGTASTSSGSSSDIAAAKAVVIALGERMQNIPLLATRSMLTAALESNYGDLVDAQTMIDWETGALPAPGRKTSSPWPARIDITTAKINADGTATITGTVVEVTSTEVASGGAAAVYPVTINLKREAGRWYITFFGSGDYLALRTEVTIRGSYVCLPKKGTGQPVTLECALGVHGDDGLYYAIDTSALPSGTMPAAQTGDRVEVSGTLTPTLYSAQSAQFESYDLKGVIAAKTFKKL